MNTFRNIFLYASYFLLPFALHASSEQELLQQAHESYSEGEKAQTIAQREEHFNRALSLYTQIESITQPVHGNGKLYYDIANTYFQLGEYPWAILYYYRTLKLRPRDTNVSYNLNIALNKLGLPTISEPSFLTGLLYFHSAISLPERLQMLTAVGLLLFICTSLYIWRRSQWMRIGIVFIAAYWCIMLYGVVYTRYIAPIEGIMVQSTALSRDAGEQYAKVTNQPIPAGSKVRVLEVLPDGKWLKVLSPAEEIGYLTHTVIRII